MLETSLYLIFIAFINSFDNIGIRVAYSIGGVKVQLVKNLLISSMAFAVSFSASISGNLISRYLNETLASFLSMILLAVTGLKIILEPYMKSKDEVSDISNMSYKESISIGIALALDDVGGSVGVGLIGYHPLSVGIAFFTVSFLIFLSGNYAIKLLRKLRINKKVTSAIAGLVMIVLAVTQVLQ